MHRPRSRFLVVLFLIPLVLAPQSRAAGDEEDPQSRQARWRSSTVPGGFRTAMAELAARPEDPIAVARRAIVRAGFEAAGLGSTALPADGHYGCVYEFRYLAGAGDLSGDRRDDAFEYRFVYDFCTDEYGTTVTGVRGTDGRDLWEVELPDFGWFIPAGDLDGVPGDDVMTFEATETLVPGAYVWTITYRGLSGRDLTELWSRSYRNPWTYAQSGPSGGYVDVDFAVPAGLSDDMTGDGASDLLVARYDNLFVWDGATGFADGGSAAVLEVVSGRTGGTAAAFAGAAHRGFPDFALIPDLTGDKLEDVAVVSFNQQADGDGIEGSVTAYPGVGGPPRWRASFQADGWPYLSGAELSGDGLGDILVATYTFDDEYFFEASTEFRALSGANGSDLWTTAFPVFAWARAAGDATGDGGQDLLVYTYSFFSDDEEEEPVPAASLLGGTDGRSLWARHGDWAYSAGDATGDGIIDVLLSTSSYDEETDEYRETTELVSGDSGDTRWSAVTAGDEEYSYVDPVWADLDGDGSDDLLRIWFLDDGDVYTALSGPDGGDLWAQPAEVGGWLYYVDAAALLGPTADLLESGETFTGDSYDAFARARAGTDGSVLWDRSSAETG